ncbi:endogenous retrovirus group K member 9 Gag polyprotein [Caloenas nicobarica]|uniref:endogenous retrovirus group K member 9 Gag polyprotein n=1 Tax=Caloenas nicobarica TaxID=187106 RepID=UPI0032B72E1C
MELEAAAALLASILSKRGIESSQKQLIKLITLAQKWGHFEDIPLLFSPTEWKAVGETMWEKIIEGEEEKEIKPLRTLWRSVLETLKTMKAEQQAAMAVAEALAPESSECSDVQLKSQKSRWFQFWGLPAVRGMSGTPLQSTLEIKRLAEGAAAGEQKPEVNFAESSSTTDWKAEVQGDDYQNVGGAECRPPPTAPPDPTPSLYPPLPPSPPAEHVAISSEQTIETTAMPRPSQTTEELLKVVVQKLEQLDAEVKDIKKTKTVVFRERGKSGAVAESAAEQRQLPQPASAAASHRWSGVIRDAILEGNWSSTSLACPVQQDLQNGRAQWEPHDWKILQQAKSTITNYGIRSEATRQIVTWIFSADLMCPQDCQNLMRLLLTPAQYLLWDSAWYQRPQQEAAIVRELNDPLYGMSADMYTGQGIYSKVETQLAFSAAMHRRAAQLALDAFFALPGAHAPSFSGVRQGTTEGYSNFIDCLYESIMQNPAMDETMKARMFRILAFENANAKTKQILATLPSGAPVEEMLS